MSDNSFIDRLFRPVQPGVRDHPDIRYREIVPHPALKGRIYCYWELHTLRPLSAPFVYNVVADGCIDLFFERAHPDRSSVAGFSAANTRFPLGCTFHYTGVRFLPAAFPRFVRLNASELSNRTEPTDAISPVISEYLASRIDPVLPFDRVKSRFDKMFLSAFGSSETPEIAPGLFNALETILKTRGEIRIEKELDPGLSPRQLRRLFRQHIGGTPKTFSRVVRFQHALNGMISRDKPDSLSGFLPHGYYDQAHFIREFKTFYGTTPAKLLTLNV